jgi:predicted nuclease with RNAse H fold
MTLTLQTACGLWAGVDVGGRRKGFHAAAVDDRALVAGPVRLPSVAQAVEWLLGVDPSVVAVDSPRAPAPDGLRSRPEERALAREICALRYTPERSRLDANPYYEWIVHGFELYAALDDAGLAAIECFPTASFTCWAGRRGDRSRASWTRAALGALGVTGRSNQDERDAVAAALTARCSERGEARRFGAIVVPV